MTLNINRWTPKLINTKENITSGVYDTDTDVRAESACKRRQRLGKVTGDLDDTDRYGTGLAPEGAKRSRNLKQNPPSLHHANRKHLWPQEIASEELLIPSGINCSLPPRHLLFTFIWVAKVTQKICFRVLHSLCAGVFPLNSFPTSYMKFESTLCVQCAPKA